MLNERDIPIPAEVVLHNTIADVDAYLTSIGHPRKPGERAGRCGDIARQLMMHGERNGLYIPRVDLARVHRVFGGNGGNFAHHFNISENQELLIDLSFCQFVDPDKGLIFQFEGYPTGNVDENSVAKALLDVGFVALNDSVLRSYLELTTVAQDKAYIRSATVEGLRDQNLG